MESWQWLDSTEIDCSKMDQSIAKNQRSIYAYSYYLQSVSKFWGAYVLGDYTDVYPFSYTLYMGVKALYVPNFAGVSFRLKDQQDFENVKELIKKDWKYFDLHFYAEDSAIQNGKNYQTISLKEEYQSDFSSNTKRQIKKAEKQEISITPTDNWQEVFNWFESETFPKIPSLQKSDLPFFKTLLTRLEKEKVLTTLAIMAKGEIVGGGFFIKDNNSIIYLKGASRNEEMRNGSMFLLLSEAMQHFESSFSIFDFGGSAVDNVAEFNRKLGGQTAKTIYLKSKALPFWYQQARKIYRKIKS